NRFGAQAPVLFFASDLDHACEFAENAPDQTRLVVIDGSGRSATKTASLSRLGHFNIPTLAVVDGSHVEEIDFDADENHTVWEWDNEDFCSLVWTDSPGGASERRNNTTVQRYEARLKKAVEASVEVCPVPLPQASRTFEELKSLQALFSKREGEPPQ